MEFFELHIRLIDNQNLAKTKITLELYVYQILVLFWFLLNFQGT